MPLILPKTINYNSASETPEQYLSRLYEQFRHDFFIQGVYFFGRRVLPQRDPITNGREYAFNHIAKTDVSSATAISFKRAKRIPQIATILNNCPNECIKCWEFDAQYRKKWVARVKVWYEDEALLIILQPNQDKYYLVTAFTKSTLHGFNGLNEEYQESSRKLT